MRHTLGNFLVRPLLYIFVCFCYAVSSHASAILPQTQVYLDSVDNINAAALGIYIEEIGSGNVVLDINGELPLVPASTTKVITVASLFTSGNINSTFTTEVYIQGPVADSILKGNIIVSCSGDPTLESSHFKEQNGFPDALAKAIAALGIDSITGQIIIESPDWIGTKQPAGWKDDDFTWPYGAGYLPVNFADNSMSVTLSRNEAPVCNPAVPGATFRRVSRKGSGIERRRDSYVYTFYHSSSKPATIRIANGSPVSSLRQSVLRSLESAGIGVGEHQIKGDRKKRTLVYTHNSAPFNHIMKSLMLRSDNMMAEAMLRQLAPGQSRKEALARQKLLWTERGIDFSDIVIEDGSGLSRNNRITPYFMADILAWMLESCPDFMDFYNFFPIAGRSGTLRSFLKDTPLDGRLRAKTGSLNGVQCYAGYATDPLGVPTHIVVIMINGFKGERATLKKQLERLLIEKIQ